MSKVAIKKQQIIQRLAHHLLVEGLNQTGLRLLAQVAGTSNRMLIYYFGSKDGLLDEVLGAIAADVTVQLDRLLGTHTRPAPDLLAQLTDLMRHEAAFRPAIQLWFELVGLAARGQEPYLANTRVLADQWIGWIAARLEEGTAVDPHDLYAHLEGRLMLSLIQE